MFPTITIDSDIVVMMIVSKLNQQNFLASVTVAADMLIYVVSVFLASVVTANAGQGLYKIIVENMKPCENNLNPIGDLSSLKISHYNRTAMVIQGALKVFRNIDDSIMLRLVVYSRSGHGAWVKTPVDTRNVSICDFIRKDEYWYPAIVKISDLPRSCPVQKGEYHFDDATLQVNKFPIVLPKGCYKAHINVWSHTLSSCYNIFAQVIGAVGSATPPCTS